MVTRHSYASTDEFRDYLAGTSYSSGWTSDANILRRIMESSSGRIDNYVGMQSFGPRMETHYYDIGRGTLRETPQPSVPALSGGSIGVSDRLIAVIPLDDWLVSPTTVTSYKATDRSSSETLTQGYSDDYWLEPYNFSPKVRLKLNEDTSKGFHSGQQTLSILGTWGYSNNTESVTTVDAVSSTTATSVSVGSASDLSPAQTILVNSEQMYITGISGNTLTLERGVNGTTAATHSGGDTAYRFLYDPLVVQACLDLSKIYFRDRDMGTTLTIGTGDTATTRSEESSSSVLSTLDQFRSTTPVSEVYF